MRPDWNFPTEGSEAERLSAAIAAVRKKYAEQIAPLDSRQAAVGAGTAKII